MQQAKKTHFVPPIVDVQAETAAVYQDVQQRIIAAFTALEPNGVQFTQTPWEKAPGEQLQGTGIMAQMHGDVFEKVGVNFSNVFGTFSELMRAQIRGAQESGGHFRATGVSLVAHMKNPFVPAVHFNIRRIETVQSWFGGGADLTPTFPFPEDTAQFHAALQAACNAYQPGCYQHYKEWCDRYFFLPHRNEPRGVGGIFFDDLNSNQQAADLEFTLDVAAKFCAAFCAIVEKRRHTPWTEADREQQLLKRGRYVEFNLLYDRGTKFGFQTGGNPEAILMSMPPYAKWA